MADDFQVTRPGRAAVDPAATSRRMPPISDNPEVARAQIEATRARMSETIDEIEDALLRKKEKIRAKLDVLAPVRERPLQTIGVIFGVGLALGLLGGGGHDDEDGEDEDEDGSGTPALAMVEDEEEDDEDFDDADEDEEEEDEAWATAELWEDRAHRLLRIARAQESELEMHREREARAGHHRQRHGLLSRREEEPETFVDRIREATAERLSGFITEMTERMMRG